MVSVAMSFLSAGLCWSPVNSWLLVSTRSTLLWVVLTFLTLSRVAVGTRLAPSTPPRRVPTATSDKVRKVISTTKLTGWRQGAKNWLQINTGPLRGRTLQQTKWPDCRLVNFLSSILNIIFFLSSNSPKYWLKKLKNNPQGPYFPTIFVWKTKRWIVSGQSKPPILLISVVTRLWYLFILHL